MRIAVVAPSTPISVDTADRVAAIARTLYPTLRLDFHPQCFLVHNHFAGTDEARSDAFVEVANSEDVDAIWFARGGYGSCRIAEDALARLGPAARGKLYLGYSDAGYMLAGLYRAGFEVAHGPMPGDIKREGGEEAVTRSLRWLVERDESALESSLSKSERAAAFNLTVLSGLLGTPLEPDLTDHVLMIEDVAEYMYRTDRTMFHVTSTPALRRVAGIRLGRCSEVPKNDPDFGESEEEVVRYWCRRAGIAYLGRADIGHDVANKIVPFGKF